MEQIKASTHTPLQNGHTPALWASAKGNVSCLRELIEKKCNIEAKNKVRVIQIQMQQRKEKAIEDLLVLHVRVDILMILCFLFLFMITCAGSDSCSCFFQLCFSCVDSMLKKK